MRVYLTAFIIGLAFMNVAANVRGQNVTLRTKNAELSLVFAEIKKQTGYLFWYRDDLLKNTKKVTLDLKNAELKEALDACIKNQPLTYTINDKTIVLKEKEKNFLDRVMDAFSSIDVKGKVMDENRQALSGATVKVKATTLQTITDANGEFYLENIAEDAIIEISYLGYITQEVKAKANLTITLQQVTSKLEEVEINAGYYKVKDRERTGSISRIDSEIISKQPVNNPLMAMQNRMTGVMITQQTGVPGGGFTVQIRGRNSISNGTDPLYIIDGVIFPSETLSGSTSNSIYVAANPLSTINTDDIESIEVLKDADATAIYGSRGANGVILITTKHSKSSSPQVNASVMQGVNQVANKMKLLNTEEYIAMRMEGLSNDGLQPASTEYDINGAWDKSRYTDWQEVLIGNRANTTNALVSASGGNDNNNYLLGGNYYKEGTVFLGDSRYERVGLHTSLGFGSSKSKLSAQFNGSYSHVAATTLRSDLTSLILLPPNFPSLLNQSGKINFENNTVINHPLAYTARTNQSGTNTFVASLTLNYKLSQGLNLKVSGGYTTISRNELGKSPASVLAPSNANYNSPLGRTAAYSDNFRNSLLVEPQVNYNGKVGPGKIDALAGLSIQESTSQLRTINGSGFSSDDLLENLASASTITVSELKYVQYRYIAGFARLNYSLADKYFINLTGRRDGSSRFGPGKKFAYFGAIGAAWVFSSESFFKNRLSFISFGKLRGSVGITGNDQIPDYQYLQLWNNSAGTYQGNQTLTPVRLGNPDYAWETNKKLEAALEIGFLKDRLRLETAYYRNRSSNQLVGNTLPLSASLQTIQANLPALVQNTGFEIDVKWNVIQNPKWSWSTSYNLTVPKNKLINYPGLAESNNYWRYAIGEPLSILKVYNTSINQSTGLYQFEDYNKDGRIDISDQYIIKYIGQYFYGALQNSIKYKQFNLDFTWSFTKQTGNNYMSGIFNAPGRWSATNPQNQPTIVLNRWQKADDQTMIQRFITKTSVGYSDAAELGGLSITDASFVRLRNVSFSFDLPKQWMNSIKVKNAQIVLQAQNVFTITKYIGLDPETQSLSNLPPLRSWVLGARINL
ncbi:SusC/RagA family TonB-linked outer membrane protein [Pedobacter insulae]|uniref:TonB-linked outer membrane protein, SusC/RagA family n=1 Tax=Pedobacter insulae TaxID=414048 RepID=A0A1I2ZIJ1_9SPHI|nr:SusC/RagA family TonB-linked outer membrane protein [Pedobacter insulae]SFH37633.1 TonB-linked outer membrane protein, SusC/RagA family [Pedobacter insulae]